MKVTYIIKAFLLFLLIPITSFANFNFDVNKKDIPDKEIKTAKIMFDGGINQEKMAKLVNVLDKIEMFYPNINKVYLYINSYGGSMDSGYIASIRIKNMKTDVTTINSGNVASAGTLLFCAGKHKLAFKDTYFLLHPASSSWNGDIKPDQLKRLSDEVQTDNLRFKSAYKACTNLSDSEINSILASESTSMIFNSEKAQQIKLIDAITDALINTDVVYYINDTNN